MYQGTMHKLTCVFLGLLLRVDDAFMATPALGHQMAQTVANVTGTNETLPNATTPNPEIYHFEVAHPNNVNVTDISYKYMNVSWMAPVDNGLAIQYFVINYQRKKLMGDSLVCPQGQMKTQNVTALPNTTFYHGSIKGLDAGTKYYICVEAVYDSNHRPYSQTLEKQTLGCGPSTAEKRCECSTFGTDLSDQCDSATCKCNCKSKFFSGDQCDSCLPGYYLHVQIGSGSCEKCDCPLDRSNGSCHATNSVVLCHCKSKYQGVKCALCANKLTQAPSGGCTHCKCNNNEDPDREEMCNPRTGKCHCGYNTAGEYCERCKEGYIGSAVNKSCRMDETASPSKTTDDDGGRSASMTTDDGSDDDDGGRSVHYQRLHVATIAGVCVGAAGLIVMLVAVCFVVRWKKLRRRPLGLWTIRLRTDDERVNFSQMADSGEDDGSMGGGRQLFEKDHQPAAHRSSKSNIYRAVRT